MVYCLCFQTVTKHCVRAVGLRAYLARNSESFSVLIFNTMKKILIFVLGLIFTGTYGQEKIRAGVKAGITSSDIYYNENVVADPRGFSGGAFLSIPVGKYLGVQPGVIYTQRALLLRSSSPDGSNFSFTRTTNNVDIPFYFQIRPIGFLTIVGGPQYSFILDKTDRFRDGRLTDEQKREVVESNLRNGNFGIAAGIDINIGFIVLSGRMGCDLQQSAVHSGSFSPQYNNRWMQAMLGIRI
jgi:hypothetical protein